MGKVKTIARRSFLIGSIAIAGGIAFGAYTVRKPHDNPIGVNDGEATFNPFVKVTPDAVTLITPHVDIGQGAVHMQALLIAEEMDLALDGFETSFGTPDPAYFNTAFADEGVPFMSRDDSAMAETMRTVVGYVVKTLGVQGTGGSTSVPDSFDKLRMAGAVARETLKHAAAQETGVAVGDLTTKDGAVILPDGTQVPYTELASTAAQLDPVTDVALRDPSQWRYIGKRTQRMDIADKSFGKMTFGIDMKMDGMVHAAVRFNPRQGGAINAFDAQAAKEMRGVTDIIEVTGGIAAIADNTWRAIRAVEAVDVDWAEAPYPAEQSDHWQALSESFTKDRLDSEWRHDGDVPAALESADTISAEYRAPYVAHAPLEPLNAIALITEDRADIWTSHQFPRAVEDMVSAITGLPVEQVALHNQYAGGSFGHRLEFENVRYATEIAMKLRGTPVKLTFSREEDFAHDYPRQIAMGRADGVVSNGVISTYDLKVASPSPIASQVPRAGLPVPPGPDMQIIAGAWNMPYAIENLRVTAYRAPELAPVSSWRSVGASHAGFFAEGFLDELLIAANQDPMQGRLDLCDYDIARQVLEAVADMSDWGSDLGPNRGRGVAFVSSFGVPTAEVVEVTATDNGIQIDKVFVAADVGQIVDPDNFENNVKGGVIWGLGHAMNCEITYSDGMAEQQNYDSHTGLRMYQTPEIYVRGLENAPKIRGIGEPPVPPAAPALANAIFDATGQRLREMPFTKFVDFA
ncbi:xanthine dehydrogenase family protein molybdopterin-binding subunit [Nereida sp. MMG025]|uniref:xanthine dehydrogenase family protein molybdopterin-binding subunit n=1 Tax=Nereida sp. MMG025 TaxID=2909981 RepID=UPI001F236D2E|nr:molybdopterin cofactor-binding domain-containing protein [Nereida sp. MMG025]MCF6445767.1 molybdopterin-dependent oxidoreductase [Nereida sp. MMG025]